MVRRALLVNVVTSDLRTKLIKMAAFFYKLVRPALGVFPWVSSTLPARIVATPSHNRWTSTEFTLRQPPKKPPPPYVLFVMKKLSESDHDDTKQSIKDIFRECGAMWKSMSESEKKHYMELHELKKKEWDVAYQTFMDGLPDKDNYLRQLKALRGERRKYLKTYREKRANKLTKPPRKLSAFNIYMRDQLGGVTKEEIQERFKEAGHGWKALSEDIKAEYKREAQQINDHEMEEFMLKKAA